MCGGVGRVWRWGHVGQIPGGCGDGVPEIRGCEHTMGQCENVRHLSEV